MNTAQKPFSPNREWRAFLRDLSKAIGLLAVLWLFFAGVNRALPYIGPGAEVVYSAKTEMIRSGSLFRRDAPVKVVIFGNSQVLAGFQPELFDSLSGGTVSSCNLGLPDYLRFIAHLEDLCQRGERPTHVLLMFPWREEPKHGFNLFRLGIEDKRVMDVLFPFRKLPRNLVLFTIRSRSRGGLRAYYEECRRQIQTMLAQKGYYFIEGQSHYPGHRLPDDFRLQKDDPTQPFLRSAPTEGSEFQRLTALAERYDIRVILVPRYFREGEVAPPEPQSVLAARLAQHSKVSVQGPDCWLLPNRYFSDPTHLNREGAAYYTQQLWALLGPALKPSGFAPSEGAPKP
jgi:hypothetical protein